MLVVDTNVIAYLYLPTKYTLQAEQLRQRDAKWVAPLLWRSEMRSVLRAYMHQQLIDLQTAISMQDAAECLLQGNEYAVASAPVLALAADSGCSAYDCEFIALARDLDVPLVTVDKKLLKAFPESTLSLHSATN